MKSFPLIRDLVTDVSWNYRVKKTIRPFKPRPPDARRNVAHGTRRMSIAFRSSENASSATSARTYATCYANISCTTISSGRDFSFMLPLSKCIRSIATADERSATGAWHRILQHHKVLYEGVS